MEEHLQKKKQQQQEKDQQTEQRVELSQHCQQYCQKSEGGKAGQSGRVLQPEMSAEPDECTSH